MVVDGRGDYAREKIGDLNAGGRVGDSLGYIGQTTTCSKLDEHSVADYFKCLIVFRIGDSLRSSINTARPSQPFLAMLVSR